MKKFKKISVKKDKGNVKKEPQRNPSSKKYDSLGASMADDGEQNSASFGNEN
jgi:hypothetical protein